MNSFAQRGLTLSDQLGVEVPPRREKVEESFHQQSRVHDFDLPFEEGHTYLLQDAARGIAIRLVFHQLDVSKAAVGLAETLKGRVGISAYVTESVPQNPVQPRPALYLKNGILVGHAGRRITSADVASALAEE
jgi:hypothetical protein